MAFRKLAGYLLLIAMLVSSSFAQAVGTDAAKDKEKELRELFAETLERAIGEIGGLQLAQNRAVTFGLVGDICWNSDQKRAREMFRSGASELITYQAEVDRDRLAALNPNDAPQDFESPRYEFINLVGLRDPELGLDIMQQTRPAAVAEAMAKVAQQSPPMPGVPAAVVGPELGRAMQEINLEDQFKMRIAMNDPEKTVKAIRESLAKGLSPNVTTMLQSLLQKDEKLATELGSEVVGKLTGSDLSKSQPDLNGALSILQFMGRTPPAVNPNMKSKYFAFSPAQTKESAYAVANTFLQPSPPATVNSLLSRAIPIVEKIAPDKALLMKQREAQNKRPANATAASGGRPGVTPPARAFDPNGTPEEILAAAAKANPRDRMSAYQAAANRITTITDEARARRLAESLPDERLRSIALQRFDSMRLSKLTAEGNLEEARRQAAALPNLKERLRWLVNLAIQFKAKNTEKDTDTAMGLMSEARTLTNVYPEDEDQLAEYMELVRGYASVDPDTAFRMFEPMVTEFDEIVQASATLSKFNRRDRTFKKGEMVMRTGTGGGGSLLPFRYSGQIQSLAQTDFERANILVDRFRRGDARLLMRLYVLQGWQRRNLTPAPPAQSTTAPPVRIAN